MVQCSAFRHKLKQILIRVQEKVTLILMLDVTFLSNIFKVSICTHQRLKKTAFLQVNLNTGGMCMLEYTQRAFEERDIFYLSDSSHNAILSNTNFTPTRFWFRDKKIRICTIINSIFLAPARFFCVFA